MKPIVIATYNALLKVMESIQLDKYTTNHWRRAAYQGLIDEHYEEVREKLIMELKERYGYAYFSCPQARMPLYPEKPLDESHTLAFNATITVHADSREEFNRMLARKPEAPKPHGKWEKEGEVNSKGIPYTRMKQEHNVWRTIWIDDLEISVHLTYSYCWEREGLPGKDCKVECVTHSYHTVSCNL